MRFARISEQNIDYLPTHNLNDMGGFITETESVHYAVVIEFFK